MLRLFLIGIFIWTISVGVAQNSNLSTSSKKAAKLYTEAASLMRFRNFDQAIEKLMLALKKDPDFVEAHSRLANCYQLFRDVEKEKFHLLQVVRLAGDNPRFINSYLNLAELQFNSGQYNSADSLLNDYLKSARPNKRLQERINRLAANIDFALKGIETPLNIEPSVLPAPINEFAMQYFPVLTADEQTLFFTRREGFNASYDEDIYVSQWNESGGWSIPESISDNINSPANEGTCTISANGRLLIFTSCSTGRPSYGRCDLYICYKIGDNWSEPKNMGSTINSRSWDSQPSLSADGRTLYFVSDRRGGFGQRDIYVSNFVEGNGWSQARNLGPSVNTSQDEVSPFIHANGHTLYFSSTGYEGFGGFDLFYVKRELNGWSKPKNVGYPINTHENQISFSINSIGSKGYYAVDENKDGDQESKLFQIDIKDEIGVDEKSLVLKGNIIDAETRKPLEANIELINTSTNEHLFRFKSDGITGEYLALLNDDATYALYVEKQGYLFESRSFQIKNILNLRVKEIDFELQPIKKNATVILNNIYFDFNSYELRPDSQAEIEKIVHFLDNNPQLKLEIQGHTDNVGQDSYNKQLSMNRAEAVYNGLISSGISSERITFKGFGSLQPIANNSTEEGRQENRRIELVIR